MDLRLEREYSSALARRDLSPELYQQWNEGRSSHRFLAYQGKKLVCYTLAGDRPTVVKVLSCVAGELDLETGLSTRWVTSDEVFTVTHSPSKVAEGVFMWHVFDGNVQYMPHAGIFSTSLATAWKSPLNPSVKVEGVVYILEKTAFDATFPHGAD